ncbi:MAG: dihydroorotate dehydrogenase [Clostridiales bacterium]|nr:dihydroorotate dehydrogenase [Clostridiales bacterium]
MNLSVNIAGVTLKNPVMPASGTFGNGREYAEFVDINRLGAVVTKSVSIKPQLGNPPCRITETASGILNSVGLQNAGVDAFLRDDLPFLKQFDTRVIVNICGHTIDEYAAVAEALLGTGADLLELNISCPNVAEGGLSFGVDPKTVQRVVAAVKKRSGQPLIVKLSPNVTSISEIAAAAESAGADAISLINTLLGMKIDIKRRKFALPRKVGGLSGPAIKPVAVRMVYEASRAVRIPIIGMGGIMTGEDAVEMMMAGASAVAVGAANFRKLTAAADVLDELIVFMNENGLNDITELSVML